MLNKDIKLEKVILIDENGINLGEKKTSDALKLAEDKDLDLYLVSGNTAKILDYEKYLYTKKKNEKVQKSIKIKEVKFSLKIAENDFNIKIRHISELLEKNHVLIKVEMKGRELNNPNLGFNLLNKILGALKIEGQGTLNGKNVCIQVNKR